MKILVLYFSMSGRTEKVAETIVSSLNSSDVTIKRFKYAKKLRDLIEEDEDIRKGDLSNFTFDRSVLDLKPLVLFSFFLDNSRH